VAVPVMRNLHAFNWVCPDGHTRYQGPSGPCQTEGCGKETTRDVVWIAKERPESTSYSFDKEPHFQYNREYTRTAEYKRGIIVGYKLSFDNQSLSPSIVGLLTDFANTHHLSSGAYSFWSGENVSTDAMSFPSVNNGGSVRTSEVLSIGNKLEVGGITTSPILTEVVENGDTLASPSGQRGDQPSIGNSVSECFIAKMGATTITPNVNTTSPVPTAGSIINCNAINELNRILGGEFVYNEKTRSFHNGSVALTTVHDKTITETMSLQGSFFMVSRHNYWKYEVNDEKLGNWGNQGIELACAMWLSGGRVLVNHKTWYAHMFRTQGADFGFPWEAKDKDIKKTKGAVMGKFWDKKHPRQIHSVKWLVEKFAPVPGWHDVGVTYGGN
jgi:hypothetical protein